MKYTLPTIALAALLAAYTAPAAAQADEPFIGEIMVTGFTFCPRGWAEANGQLLSISQNTALFSLYGTTYGGDGRTTFALPDIRGRVAADQGAATGQPTYSQGEKGGTNQATLTVSQMPAHTHLELATSAAPSTNSPNNAAFGTFGATQQIYNSGGPPQLQFKPGALGNTGGSQPFDNMQPYLTMRFCVAVVGIFPSRN